MEYAGKKPIGPPTSLRWEQMAAAGGQYTAFVEPISHAVHPRIPVNVRKIQPSEVEFDSLVPIAAGTNLVVSVTRHPTLHAAILACAVTCQKLESGRNDIRAKVLECCFGTLQAPPHWQT